MLNLVGWSVRWSIGWSVGPSVDQVTDSLTHSPLNVNASIASSDLVALVKKKDLKGSAHSKNEYFFSSRSKKLNATNLSVIRAIGKKPLVQWGPFFDILDLQTFPPDFSKIDG